MKAVHFFAVALLAAAAAVARAEEPFYLQPRLIDALSTTFVPSAALTTAEAVEPIDLLVRRTDVDVEVAPLVEGAWTGLLTPLATTGVSTSVEAPSTIDQLLAPSEADWRQVVIQSLDWSPMTVTTILQQPTVGNFLR
jgi:hypothetical protein